MDPELHRAFKDLLAAIWNQLPNVVISDVKAALSKNCDDKAGKEVLANIFHAAEAVVEFGDMVMNLKMELDDIVGMSGEVFLYVQIGNFLFYLSANKVKQIEIFQFCFTNNSLFPFSLSVLICLVKLIDWF